MLILASASPRRQELLKQITKDFMIKTADIPEHSNYTKPVEIVQDLALQKANAVYRQNPSDIIIGADTIVVLEDNILGKPKDTQDAYNMLKQLSGTVHKVYTGVAIVSADISSTFAVDSQVSFTPLTHTEIKDYIATGEPMDKAGSYGIQGYGSKFIKNINGDFFSVMGLPVSKLYFMLKKYKIL